MQTRFLFGAATLAACVVSICAPLAAQPGMVGYTSSVSSLWIPDAAAFNSVPLTVEGWLYIDPPAGTSLAENGRIVQKGNSGVSYQMGPTWTYGGFLRASVSVLPQGLQYIDSTQVLSTHVWYHAALVMDGSTASLYLDGILQQSIAVSAAPVPTPGEPFLIGYALGKIDEVRVWSVARTQAEIQETMHRRIDGHPNLVSAWHFDGNLLDLTGGHHATIPFGSAFIVPSTSPVGPLIDAPAMSPIWSPIPYTMSHCAPSSPYLLEVSATGTSPGIPIPPPFPPGTFPLNPPFLFSSYGAAFPQLFSGFVGTTDAVGSAQGTLHIPNEPALIGIEISAAYAAFDSAVADGFGGVSLPRTTTINDFPPLAIDQVFPEVALPGTIVTVTGQGFRPVTAVDVAGSAVTSSSVTPSQITFAAPPGVPCDSQITLTNPGDSTQAAFNPAPAISSTANDSGPSSGGQTMFVIGAHFAPGTTVTVGGANAQLSFLFETVLALVVPPGTPGPSTVVVISPTGCTASTAYTYF